MKEIKGIVMPIMTPFTDDGEVDEPMGCALTDFLIGAGVHALFLLGSFGQGPVLRTDQRKRFAELIIRHVGGRVPVVVHVGTAEAYSTAELGLDAEAAGADAIAVVGPYYYSDHTEYEIMEHFKEVGQRVKAPMMVYQNPPYSGYDITPFMMLRLKEHVPQIFGVKISADSLEIALNYVQQLPKDIGVYGLASALLPGALYGIRGTIVPTMISFPELAVALWRALEEKNLSEALILQTRVNEIRNVMRSLRKTYGEAVQREALRLRGLAVKKFPRWTTRPFSPEDRAALAQALRNGGVPIAD
ncbi:MAG TPA: dihydrodipicolinate synthase family protein [Candidatus Binatia bacterium]